MATEKTWQFDMNHTYAASSLTDMARYMLWYYKAFLTGQVGGATQGLWTLVGSSDAVTGAMDTTDRWGSAYTASKLVRASSGSPHSWCVLKSPLINGQNYYLLLDWNTGNDYQLSVTLGAVSIPTGGSYTTAPTVPNSTNSSLSNPSFSMSTNAGSMKTHGQLATDGSFNIFGSRDNTSQFFSGFIFHALADKKAIDQFPCWCYLNGDPSLSKGFGCISSPYIGLDYTQNGVARAPDNSTGIVSPAAILPTSTYVPNGPDSFDGSYIDWPLWIGSRDNSTRCIKGRLQDIAYFGGGAATGAVDNPSGTPSFMVVYNFWFPTNAAPLL